MGITRTEDRILSSAMILFVEQGYYATSVPDIVKHSKTSTGAVYHHFGSKTELARQLHQQVVSGFMESATTKVLATSGARTQTPIGCPTCSTRDDDIVPAPLYALTDEATDAIWPGLSA